MKHREWFILLAVVLALVYWDGTAEADPYLNCGTTEPTRNANSNTLMCDDFEVSGVANSPNGMWYGEDCDTANRNGGVATRTKGWCGTIYANPITPAGAAICGAKGYGGTACSADSGFHASIGGVNMATHQFLGNVTVTEAYLRLYWQPQLDYNGGHEKMFEFATGNGGNVVISCYNYFGSEIVQCIPFVHQDGGRADKPGLPSWLDNNLASPVPIIPGHWFFVEMHFIMNTASNFDGVFDLWMDDCGPTGNACPSSPTQRMHYNNLLYTTAAEKASFPVGAIWLENWANAATSGTEFYDQVVVSRVGPIGFMGSSSGGSNPPPAPPTNLRIQ